MMTQMNPVGAFQAARDIAAAGKDLPAGATRMAEDFAAIMDRMDHSATGAMAGEVETHELVQAVSEAKFALETAAAIRDKVVEAYQEILRMPV